jgi:RNA recognition motif-containing protein
MPAIITQAVQNNSMNYNPQSPNSIVIPDYYTQYNVGIATQPLVQQQMGPNQYNAEAAPYSPSSATPKYNMAVPNLTMGQFQGNNTQYSQYSPYPPHATTSTSPISYAPTSPQTTQFPTSPAQLYNSQTASSPNSQPQMMINPLLRTVYIGNLPTGTTYEELLNHVRGGKLDNVKIFDDKNYAFVTFVEASSAVAFYQSATLRRITIHNQDAKIGWGKPVQISPNILLAVQNNASRNIFIGNLDETITESYLEKEFSQFGPIDVIKVLPEKRIAFVHMTSIAAALKAIQTFQNEKRWIDHRINYGNDRCALPVKLKTNSNSNALLFGNNNGLPYSQYGNNSYPNLLQLTSSTATNYPNLYSNSFPTVILNSNPTFNRTVYLGGFGPDITIKDICDVIRGGILQEIKYKSEGNCAFVTFVDPNTATSFYNKVSCEGIIIKGKRITKVGWGKHPTLSQHLSTAIQNGATRNVYIGQLEEGTTEEKLRKDFSEFGDIELINLIPEKRYGFVNFTSIKAAVKAVENIKNRQEYQNQKISYGKDRCGNPVHERNHDHYNNYKMSNSNNNNGGLNSPKPVGNENEEASYKNVIQQA